MKRKYTLIGLLFVLTACGQDVALALDRDTYNGQMFSDNMYQDTVLTSTLAPANISDKTTINVPTESAVVGVANLKAPDNVYNSVAITDDVYAQSHKLSNALPAVKNGFESKLFDGILHCSDAIRLSKSRLQIRESGFGYVFPSSLAAYDHVGVYLKAGADTYSGGVYISDLRVRLSFYVPSATNEYDQFEFVMDVTGVRRSDFPQFYGFYFQDVATGNVLLGATAVSLTYEILDAAAASSQKDFTAIFVYELLLAKSSWN